MNGPTSPILLVEDDRNDAFFLQYAFENAGITNPLQVAEDGQEAIDYLAGEGKYSDREQFPFPCLVLLDLKLPIKMGLDVLAWIHEQPYLQRLLVIILTASKDGQDIDEAYRLGARSFLVKPLSLEERLHMARAIKSYWLELNQFPTISATSAEPSAEPAKRQKVLHR